MTSSHPSRRGRRRLSVPRDRPFTEDDGGNQSRTSGRDTRDWDTRGRDTRGRNTRGQDTKRWGHEGSRHERSRHERSQDTMGGDTKDQDTRGRDPSQSRQQKEGSRHERSGNEGSGWVVTLGPRSGTGTDPRLRYGTNRSVYTVGSWYRRDRNGDSRRVVDVVQVP